MEDKWKEDARALLNTRAFLNRNPIKSDLFLAYSTWTERGPIQGCYFLTNIPSHIPSTTVLHNLLYTGIKLDITLSLSHLV
jgi:hypothetical protein